MSNKVQAFAKIITQPLNVHNFRVVIPAFDYDFIVQSTQFPTEEMQIVQLFTQGEPVRYPTIPRNSGEWAVKVPENDDGKIWDRFRTLKNRQYDQVNGLMNPQPWFDCQIFARDLANRPVFQTILHGCWIKGRGEVGLDNSNPTNSWIWDFKFVYQWLEDAKAK